MNSSNNIEVTFCNSKASVSLDNIDTPANMTDWPEFHNGVAAGLKIIPGISTVSLIK